MRRFWLALATAAMAASTFVPTASAANCGYKLGFKTIADQIPDKVKDCLVDEHYNPLNGDSLQETTGGLLVWRKADNFTAFTDGYRTWVNGPFGLQMRLNTERFPWEPATPPPPPPTPVPPPAPAATPAPAAPTATPAPAALEPAPTINNPPSGTHVGEAAKLEWDWYRGLASNEEFVVHVEPTSPGMVQSRWIGTRDKFLFTPGNVLPPGRSITWQIYVRQIGSTGMISQVSETRVVVRD